MKSMEKKKLSSVNNFIWKKGIDLIIILTDLVFFMRLTGQKVRYWIQISHLRIQRD
jgi:hypothetical protein